MLTALAQLAAQVAPAIPVQPPTSENAPIWVIVILLILDRVFAFIAPLMKRSTKDRPEPDGKLNEAVHAISENLVKLRENEEKEKELFFALQKGLDTTLENTVAIRAMSHNIVNTQQRQILISEEMRDEMRAARHRRSGS